MQTIQMHLSEKPTFLKPTSNFECFQTNMTLIPYEFPKLRTMKDAVT